ncbi:MAG: PilZ domain-containing protein [Rhodospirillales bacterium]|nr:PilZ domain-containing protein [Rhodospirillales bacterium]
MERRRFTRHEVALPVQIHAGERGFVAETVNISGSGLAVKLESSALSGGGRVSVTIGELGEFNADVIDGGRLRLDISEQDQARLADDIVRKLAHMMPV